MAVYIEAEQRAEIQRIANAEDATASRVYRAALKYYGLPELRKALQARATPRRAGSGWRAEGGGRAVP